MAKQADRSKEILSRWLIRNGLRRTTEREAVLERVEKTTGLFSATDLFRRMRAEGNNTITLATVYSALRVLQKAGLVQQHVLSPRKMLYERTGSDDNPDRAASTLLVCSGCGKTRRVRGIEPLLQLMNVKFPGFRTRSCDVTIHGLCTACSRKGGVTETPNA